ncbi:MAG: hypothetical protein K6D94_13445 [Clostridiales bacterium]|nr:hypothetical protein [Clostridiales bacterium]
MKKRILSLIFSALLCASAVAAAACGESSDSPSPAAAAASQDGDSPAETEPAETEPQYEPDDLPSDLSFGGAKINLLGWDYSSRPNDVEFGITEANGEIVNDAIYERNRKVEERINIDIVESAVPGDNGARAEWVKFVEKSVMAGAKAYDIVAGYSMCGASLAYKNLLWELNDRQYLNFDKPWWPDSLLKEAVCDGKLYFASGDISTNMIYMLYVNYFNKAMFESFGIENPYELVRSGTWTIDKLMSMVDTMYSDLNGDGNRDVGDQFGYVNHITFSDGWFFASGLRTTTVGDEGLPVLSPLFGGERAQGLLDKLNTLFSQPGGFLIDYSYDDAYNLNYNMFMEGRIGLTTTEALQAYEKFRFSDINYGILPMAKYDETQSDYYTVSSFPYSLYGIPVDVDDPDRSAAVLEALASESYRTVSPALFEVALKVKYSQDADSTEMWDLIRSSNVFDFGRIFNDNMNSETYSLYRNAIGAHTADWISTYAKAEKRLTKALAKVVEHLTAEG